MDDADDRGSVRAVPGGAALAEVIGKLETAQPEVITGAAEQFRSGQEGAGRSLGELARAVSGLDGRGRVAQLLRSSAT